jgi:probable rRNA maturation factor
MTRDAASVSVSYGLPRRGLPSAASFRRWVALALGVRRGPAELSIRVVSAPEGRRLNRDYRGKDYATNVLSFPVELPEGVSLPLLGDIVLCAPVIAREAREQGKSRPHHYAHLTVHGVLHLLGHQHERPAQARRMERIETQLLETIGIPDPYAGALRP